jgi:hypothetical protein
MELPGSPSLFTRRSAGPAGMLITLSRLRAVFLHALFMSPARETKVPPTTVRWADGAVERVAAIPDAIQVIHQGQGRSGVAGAG